MPPAVRGTQPPPAAELSLLLLPCRTDEEEERVLPDRAERVDGGAGARVSSPSSPSILSKNARNGPTHTQQFRNWK